MKIICTLGASSYNKNTLKQGASGLVLAAETAIGINPVGCVKFLKKSIRVYRKFKK